MANGRCRAGPAPNRRSVAKQADASEADLRVRILGPLPRRGLAAAQRGSEKRLAHRPQHRGVLVPGRFGRLG